MGKRRGNRGRRKLLASLPPKKNWADLPFHIIQLIQSFLDDRYAVRSTLLSKSWLGASSTSPNVIFYRDMPFSPSPPVAELMSRTLVRYLGQNILVEKLHIYATSGGLWWEYKDYEFDQQVNRWLKFAYESGRPRGVSGEPPCPPLRVLKLHHVRMVDIERDFYALLSGCPLLEEIILYECKGIGRVVVTADSDLLRLFEIKCLHDDALVEIFTPALRSFSYGNYDGTWEYDRFELERARVIDIDACRFLTDLSFDFLKIDDWCLDDMSRFMFLKRLALDHCDLPRRTVIASGSLKKLRLQRCNYSLEELDVRCDSLSELSLSSRDRYMSWCHGNGKFLLRCSASPKIQLIVVDDDLSYPIDDYDWLEDTTKKNTLEFLKGLTSFRLDLNICGNGELLREQEDGHLVDMRSIYGLPFMNVEAIRLDRTLNNLPRCLDFLFLAFRPNYIFSRWESCRNNIITKFLLSELMDRKKKCGCSARGLGGVNPHKVSCWRHLLKDRRVMLRLSSDDDDGMWQPLEPVYHWRHMVQGSQDLIGAHDIRFTLTWHTFDEEAESI